MSPPVTDMNNHRLRRFLLGEAGEDERAALERRLLRDDDPTYEELLAAEDELRFEYLRGRLSAAERARFETRYLGSPAGRTKLAFARALIDAADAVAPAPAMSGERPARRWNPALGYALLAAATVALATSTIVLVQKNRRLEQDLQRQREQQAQVVTPPAPAPSPAPTPAPAPAPPAAPALALVLIPNLTRGGGEELPRGDERIAVAGGAQLTLRLPPDARRAASYRVVIQDPDGRGVWKGTAPRTANGVVVEVPPRVLRANDYQLDLAAGTTDIATYYFRIRR
jgi:hypothetical protein